MRRRRRRRSEEEEEEEAKRPQHGTFLLSLLPSFLPSSVEEWAGEGASEVRRVSFSHVQPEGRSEEEEITGREGHRQHQFIAEGVRRYI